MKLTNIRVHTKAPYIKLSRFSTQKKSRKSATSFPGYLFPRGRGTRDPGNEVGKVDAREKKDVGKISMREN